MIGEDGKEGRGVPRREAGYNLSGKPHTDVSYYCTVGAHDLRARTESQR